MNPPDAPSPPDSDRLSGWKEIASFLGKSVRTVQRWEADYGLPVKRLGREGGEIVWASRAEISRWSIDAAHKLEPLDPEVTARVAPSPALPGSGTPSRLDMLRRFRWAAWCGAAAIAALVLWESSWKPAKALTPQPRRGQVVGNVLSVFDDNGHLCFNHPFPISLSRTNYDQAQYRPGEVPIVIHDLDGDGTRQVIFMTDADPVSDQVGLYVFNADGSERFRRLIHEDVQFGDRTFNGPWLPSKVFVHVDATGKSSIWAAFIHAQEFPTLLEHLDSHGNVLSSYWSNGYIEDLSVQTLHGRNRVLVGGTDNDTKGASLAVFDGGEVWGSAPSAQREYQCTRCPGRAPSAFLVFPRGCLATKMEQQPTVSKVWVGGDNYVHVLRVERLDGLEGGVYYTLDENLKLSDVVVTPELDSLHARFRAEGLIDHGLPVPRDVFPVRSWIGGQLIPLPEVPMRR